MTHHLRAYHCSRVHMRTRKSVSCCSSHLGRTSGIRWASDRRPAMTHSSTFIWKVSYFLNDCGLRCIRFSSMSSLNRSSSTRQQLLRITNIRLTPRPILLQSWTACASLIIIPFRLVAFLVDFWTLVISMLFSIHARSSEVQPAYAEVDRITDRASMNFWVSSCWYMLSFGSAFLRSVVFAFGP